jgi:Ca2+-transporting ATPase
MQPEIAQDQIGLLDHTGTAKESPGTINYTQLPFPIPAPPFGIGPDELHFLVNFDLRDDASHLAHVAQKYNGVTGLAELLKTSLDKGLLDVGYGKHLTDETDAFNELGLRKQEGTRKIRVTLGGGQRNSLADNGKGGVSDKQRRGSVALRSQVVNTTVRDWSSQMVVKTFSTDSLVPQPKDMAERVRVFGSNLIPPEKPASLFYLVFCTIRDDPFLKILIAGALVSFVIGSATDPAHGWVDGIAILCAVLIVLTVTAGNDYSKDKKFKKLLLMQSDKKVKVMRGGFKDTVSSWDLVVGDLVLLTTGDEIPGDGVFVQGTRLVVDESPLTGESKPIVKSDKCPLLFSGTLVSEGSGCMVITAVGERSANGQIQRLLRSQPEELSPLQAKLRVVAVLVGKIGFSAGVLSFLSLLIRWAVHLSEGVLVWSNAELLKILKFFLTGVTIMVVAIPDGLPLAISISLAFSMFKMIKDKCFVRHLIAAETMGQATSICTDKTGTLTQNRMTVVRVLVHHHEYCGEGAGTSHDSPFKDCAMPTRVRELLAEAVSCNSTCFLQFKRNQSTPTYVGSATEGALLDLVRRLGYQYDEVRNRVTKVPNGEFSFESTLKRMCTVIEPSVQVSMDETGFGGRSRYRVHVKGASEVVLARCRFILDEQGQKCEELTPEHRQRVASTITSYASEGLRTVVLACRHLDNLPQSSDSEGTSYDREELESNLVLLCLVGIKDPLRQEVRGAVHDCQLAGLVVRMVTGDNLLTACKIAKECGILDTGSIAMEGPEFRALSDLDRKLILPKLRVLARSSPMDKFVFVTALKQMGEIVAVTGDGTNDAPALKEADIGFAMGISGTQIAINASDVILLDDNFVSLVRAIRWGRGVLDNVRKFLQFQLSCNICAVVVTLVGSAAMGDAPMTGVQLLWINLIMDTLGALSMASGTPDEDVLKRSPHKRKSPIMNPAMLRYVFFQSMYQAVALLSILFYYTAPFYQQSDIEMSKLPQEFVVRLHTLVFNTFVLMQLSNMFTARQICEELNVFHKVLENYIFLGVFVLIAGIQVICVFFGQSFIGTGPLDAFDWALCVIIAAASIPYTVILRMIIRGVQYYKRNGCSANDKSLNLDPKDLGTSFKSGSKSRIAREEAVAWR